VIRSKRLLISASKRPIWKSAIKGCAIITRLLLQMMFYTFSDSPYNIDLHFSNTSQFTA